MTGWSNIWVSAGIAALDAVLRQVRDEGEATQDSGTETSHCCQTCGETL
jgi:hypothetical protein